MNKKKTKEELIIEVAKLEEEKRELQDSGESRRKTFSKILGRAEPEMYSRRYDGSDTLTWLEIACEIGKLQRSSQFGNLNSKVDALENELKYLLEKTQNEEKQ